jgi:L-rhamnose mutarotase
MKTYAYALDLKDQDEVIRQYVEFHKHVPAEVIEAGKKLGIISDTIYLIGNRLFRITLATDDYDPDSCGDYAEMSPVSKEWDEKMRTFQKPIDAGKPGEWWARMKQVYHCGPEE